MFIILLPIKFCKFNVSFCQFTVTSQPQAQDSDDDDWDEDDLLPLFSVAGTTLRNFVNFDNDLSTEKNTDENWEDEFIQSVRNVNESCADIENDENSDCEIEQEEECTCTLQEAWGCSTKFMNYALSTNNVELVNLLSKAQDMLKKDQSKKTQQSNQTDIKSFFNKV